ncbi:thioredoxin-disulfide reductase [Candidatus Dependentiae bacterium]|nr:thioredoxin-disulfide reductase [Candidatus Dependentiae bacterium]
MHCSYYSWLIVFSYFFCSLLEQPLEAIDFTKETGGHHTPLVFDRKKVSQVKNLIPIVVIGSGPAGLSAALYGARAAVRTIVFEGRNPGGQLTETSYVENLPGAPKLLGSELIERMRKQAESFGAVCVSDTIVEVDFSQWPFLLRTESGEEIHALTVIIATGAKPRFLSDSLDTPGEKTYWGQGGVSTCAVCDAPFYKDQKVVVVGGGDSAVEEATYLTSYADSVTMLVRGPALRAAPAMQDRLKGSQKITMLYNTTVEEIVGNGTSVTGVKIVNTRENTHTALSTDGVFLAIGHHPNSDIFKRWIATDKEGYIVAGPHDQQTSIPGIFTAGDVSDKVYKQAGVASGNGIKAALDAYAFLQAQGYSEAFVEEIESNYYNPFL